jgi:DNA-binding beta-propeller fold protein YncE
MKISPLCCRALSICALPAMLAGCGGSQPPISAPGAIPESLGFTAPPDSRQLLYVTEYTRNTVLVYDARAKNPEPKESITIGVNEPSRDCFDGAGTLYVTNYAGWVSEYPRGKRRPSRIIRRGMGNPAFCSIDSGGNLWVTDAYVERYYRRSGPCITEYKQGSKKPFTIITRGLTNPIGIAIDSAGNIYVANRTGSSGNVVVYLPGKKTPTRTITDGVTSPVGIGVDANGTLYVTNIVENDVEKYQMGASDPYETITQGLNEPVAVTLNQQGWLYVANAGNSTIAEFSPGSVKPSKRQISKELYAPQGLAYSPSLLP